MDDKVLGELELDGYVWWRSMEKSMFGSDVIVELLVQDENQEGILAPGEVSEPTITRWG